MVSETDMVKITAQLNRKPRDVIAVSYYANFDIPVVIKTAPFSSAGKPFPTLYYLVEPLLNKTISTFEAKGLMQQMSNAVRENSDLAKKYLNAHLNYLSDRNSIYDLGIDFSGGGMPNRVKCLHFLVAHSLAVGAGINPIGDDMVAILKDIPKVTHLLPKIWPAVRYKWNI